MMRWWSLPPGVSSFRAAFGLALLLFFQILSRLDFSPGDSVRSTFPLEPALLSLRNEMPRERVRDSAAWSMLATGPGCRSRRRLLYYDGWMDDDDGSDNDGRRVRARVHWRLAVVGGGKLGCGGGGCSGLG